MVCLALAIHSGHVLFQAGASYLFQWDGTIALTVVGIELILIRHRIHK